MSELQNEARSSHFKLSIQPETAKLRLTQMYSFILNMGDYLILNPLDFYFTC